VPSLIACEQCGRSAAASILEIDMAKRSSVVVPHDKAAVLFCNRPSDLVPCAPFTGGSASVSQAPTPGGAAVGDDEDPRAIRGAICDRRHKSVERLPRAASSGAIPSAIAPAASPR
jgi:hypothetical protein